MESERRGPEYRPFNEWQEEIERKRRRRSLLFGGLTVVAVLTAGTILVAPLFSRQYVLSRFVGVFDRPTQVVTSEDHVTLDNRRFDHKAYEEDVFQRRVEVEGGNVMVFAGSKGGARLDRVTRKLQIYAETWFGETPYQLLKRLIHNAQSGFRGEITSFSSENGNLILTGRGRRYVIHPAPSPRLADVDVQIKTDKGFVNAIRWRFEEVAKDTSRFNPATFTRIEPTQAIPLIVGVKPMLKYQTKSGPAEFIRADINETGDFFLADKATYNFEYDIKSSAGKLHMLPVQTERIAADGRSSIRSRMLYRGRDQEVKWPVTIDIDAWAVGTKDTASPEKIHLVFDKPTCYCFPEYEFGLRASDIPYRNHRVRCLQAEAMIAETGHGMLLVAGRDVPVIHPMKAIDLYRRMITYGNGDGAQLFTLSLTYFSLYRCYDAAGDEEAARQALIYANDHYQGSNAWLDSRFADAFQRENLTQEKHE